MLTKIVNAIEAFEASKHVATVRATPTVLVNKSHSRSSQGKAKVKIYARDE
jgi:hypothetical protein